MAYEKGINVNVLAESGQTDEETIEMYESEYPQITLALKGKEELNEALFEIEYQENITAIRDKALNEGYNAEEADKIAKAKSKVLLDNALKNYEKLKRKRASK